MRPDREWLGTVGDKIDLPSRSPNGFTVRCRQLPDPDEQEPTTRTARRRQCGVSVTAGVGEAPDGAWLSEPWSTVNAVKGNLAPAGAEFGARSTVPPRYRALHDLLARADADQFTMTYAELDTAIVGGLPLTARAPWSQWWTNNPGRPYARAWLTAGRLVDLDRDREVVTFSRGTRATPTLSELRRARTVRRRYAACRLRSRTPNGTDLRHTWGPHWLYEMHLADEDQYKVGVTRVGSTRLAHLTAGRDTVLVDRVEVPNRFIAEILEIDILELVERWHCLGDPSYPESGYTERWSTAGPSIDLNHLLHQLRSDWDM